MMVVEIVEVVGDAAGQLPHRRQSLLLLQLCLQVPLLGDLADDQHPPAVGPNAGYRPGGDLEDPRGAAGDDNLMPGRSRREGQQG